MGPGVRRDDVEKLRRAHHIDRALHDRFQFPARHLGAGAKALGEEFALYKAELARHKAAA
jgi:hypothetical protein